MKYTVDTSGLRGGGVGIDPFVAGLAVRFASIRSIWCVGDRADERHDGSTASKLWQLLAFANRHTLSQLRSAVALHRPDVTLGVVTDGDRLERAWGDIPQSASLSQWNWMEAGRREAFYSQANWSLPISNGVVARVRRKAICLWRSADQAVFLPR